MRRPNQVTGLEPVKAQKQRRRRGWGRKDKQIPVAEQTGDDDQLSMDDGDIAVPDDLLNANIHDDSNSAGDSNSAADGDSAADGNSAADGDSAADAPSVAEAKAAARRAAKVRSRYRLRQRLNPSGGGGIVKLAFVSVIIGLVVVLGVSVMAFTPVFAAKHISVQGGSHQLQAQVAEALADLRSQPIATISESDVRSRLAKFPALESFALAITPPNKVGVKLTERTEIGYQKTGEQFAVFDPAGVITRTVSKRPDALPEFAQGPSAKDTFEAAAAVLLALPESVRSELKTVDAKSRFDVTLEFKDGRQVAWGDASESMYKAQVLHVLLKRAGDKRFYDVSAPSAPIVK